MFSSFFSLIAKPTSSKTFLPKKQINKPQKKWADSVPALPSTLTSHPRDGNLGSWIQPQPWFSRENKTSQALEYFLFSSRARSGWGGCLPAESLDDVNP